MFLQVRANLRSRGPLLIQARRHYRFHRVCRRKCCRNPAARQVDGRADPVIYPTPDQQQRLFVQLEDSPEQSRAITRMWQRFKTGQ